MAMTQETLDRRRRIGSNIHMARWNRGWTLRDLAERSGVPDSTLSRYERGRSTPGADELVAIAEALETSPHDLLGWEDEATRAFLQGLIPADAGPFRHLARLAS